METNNWREEFKKRFVENNLWEDKGGETKFVAIGNIEDFISETIEALLDRLKDKMDAQHFDESTQQDIYTVINSEIAVLRHGNK